MAVRNKNAKKCRPLFVDQIKVGGKNDPFNSPNGQEKLGCN